MLEQNAPLQCSHYPLTACMYQRFQWMVGYAGDNIRVPREFVKWGGRANVINVGLLLFLCVYNEVERYQQLQRQ